MKRGSVLLAAALVLLCSGTFCTSCTENESPDETEAPPAQSTTVTTTTTAATTTVPPEPEPEPEEPGLYDVSPIVSAYKTGDGSKLDEYQKLTLDAAREIISSGITDDMSDYDKELYIHDWIVANVFYDRDNLNAIGEADERSVEPYGALINRKAVCAGYAATFQMFMDMLDINCISIQATAHQGRDHVWNMVELDGHWYYVDVTWDDPVPDSEGRPVKHEYFNALTEKLAEEHEWETGELPETDSTDYCYLVRDCLELDNTGLIYDYLDLLLSKNYSDGSFVIRDMPGDIYDGQVFYPQTTPDPEGLEAAIQEVCDSWKADNKHYSLRIMGTVIGDRTVFKVTLNHIEKTN